jgi:hypothetical protein
VGMEKCVGSRPGVSGSTVSAVLFIKNVKN